MVTAVPYMYFYHVGNYIYLDGNNKDYIIYLLYRDYSTIINKFNPVDHLIENYYKNLLLCRW